MTPFLTAFALAAETAMQIHAALAQQPPATVAPAAATPFDTRAAQLVDLMTGKLAFADYFAPAFQHAVPEAQFKTITPNLVAPYGQPAVGESASSHNGRQGKVKLRFAKGAGQIARDLRA